MQLSDIDVNSLTQNSQSHTHYAIPLKQSSLYDKIVRLTQIITSALKKHTQQISYHEEYIGFISLLLRPLWALLETVNHLILI